MNKILDIEQWRMVAVAGLSPLMGVLTPTKGFVVALVIMFGFNIWAGMRADGVSVVRCKNFQFRKFKNALVELVLYLMIVEIVHSVMVACGDRDAAIVAIKSLTYVCMYVYLQNAFKNLIKAYPQYPALHIIYHLIRMEFTRMMPEHWRPIVEKYKGKTAAEPKSAEK